MKNIFNSFINLFKNQWNEVTVEDWDNPTDSEKDAIEAFILALTPDSIVFFK